MKLPRTIYLAGKIRANGWRHSIVTGLREVGDSWSLCRNNGAVKG